MSDYIVWVDCEMTGLDLNEDVLVEIAVLVTDSELNILGEGVDLVIRATEEQLKGMNEFVTNMHTESGLITEIPNGVEIEKAEAEVRRRQNYLKAARQYGDVKVIRKQEARLKRAQTKLQKLLDE